MHTPCQFRLSQTDINQTAAAVWYCRYQFVWLRHSILSHKHTHTHHQTPSKAFDHLRYETKRMELQHSLSLVWASYIWPLITWLKDSKGIGFSPTWLWSESFWTFVVVPVAVEPVSSQIFFVLHKHKSQEQTIPNDTKEYQRYLMMPCATGHWSNWIFRRALTISSPVWAVGTIWTANSTLAFDSFDAFSYRVA